LDDWNGYVINLRNGRGERKQDASVRIERFDDVVQGHRVDLVEYGADVCFEPEEVIARARRRLGEKRYRVRTKNCQHFARWCKTGDAMSEHVRGVTSSAGGLAGGLAARAASITAVATIGAVHGTSSAGITSALGSAGQMVGGGAGAGVVVLTAVPAVAAAIGIHTVFADDPFATSEERSARKAARVAGTMGAITGTAIGSVALSLAGSGKGAVALTTGLKVLGAGRMLTGLAALFSVPLLTAGAAGLAVYVVTRARKRRADRVAIPAPTF
jgi:hypothetical protein